jgi:hypothetical protein
MIRHANETSGFSREAALLEVHLSNFVSWTFILRDPIRTHEFYGLLRSAHGHYLDYRGIHFQAFELDFKWR